MKAIEIIFIIAAMAWTVSSAVNYSILLRYRRAIEKRAASLLQREKNLREAMRRNGETNAMLEAKRKRLEDADPALDEANLAYISEKEDGQ